MIDVSTQPDRDEHGPKQLRASRQAFARSQFALMSGRYSWLFPAAGCDMGSRSPIFLAEKAERFVCLL